MIYYKAENDRKSYPFTVVDRFISNSTGTNFDSIVLLIVTWRDEKASCHCTINKVYTLYLKGLELQSVIASDLTSTHAIYTYLCISELKPLHAEIFYKLGNYKSESFRYSDTPYTNKIGCLNKVAGVNYYNLLYTLAGSNNTSGSSRSAHNCKEAGLLGGCCRPFQDPTISCRAGNLTNNCYCDSLCYRFGDCCSDVGREPLEKPCIPGTQSTQYNSKRILIIIYIFIFSL